MSSTGLPRLSHPCRSEDLLPHADRWTDLFPYAYTIYPMARSDLYGLGLTVVGAALGYLVGGRVGCLLVLLVGLVLTIVIHVRAEDRDVKPDNGTIFGGAIPAVSTQTSAAEESIDTGRPAVFGHANLLIQRLSLRGDVSVTSDLSAYQTNLGLFVHTSVSTTGKPHTVTAFVLELRAETAVYSAQAERDIRNYCHRHERQVKDSLGHQTTLTVRKEMYNLLALISTTPIAPDTQVDGWLHFELKKVKKGHEPKYGGKLRLYAFDARNKRYELDTANLTIRTPDTNEYAQLKQQ
jgi:hypothetical protein